MTANETNEQRLATITLTDSKDGKATRSFKVTQKQKDGIIITPDTYEVPAEGGKVAISVQHNVKFTVEINASWIKQNTTSKTRAMETSAIELNVEKNNSGAERTATVKFISSESEITKEVTIKQAFNPDFSVNTESLTIDERGGVLLILVKANFEVNTSYGDKWLSDGGREKIDNLFFYQKVQVAPFTDKAASRTSKVTLANLTLGQFKEVTIMQTRPLYIQATAVTLKVGDTYALPLCNENKVAVQWASKNADVASVDMDGKISAKAVGTTTITVTSADGLHTDNVSVTVEEKPEEESESEEETSTNPS